jgi:hypothetical protein
MEFTSTARRLGIASAFGTAVLLIAYAGTLVVGLALLRSPQEPIADPMFTMLEVLIILLMPCMVGMMVAVHAWAPPPAKVFSLTALVFMAGLVTVTSSLHFVILSLSRNPAFIQQPWTPLLLTFNWPSVAYALDIIAWDGFFALSMLFAAAVFSGSRLASWIRRSMIASGVLALAGFSGVVTGDMRLRNIGIVGYVGVFLAVTVLLAVFFNRAKPVQAEEDPR